MNTAYLVKDICRNVLDEAGIVITGIVAILRRDTDIDGSGESGKRRLYANAVRALDRWWRRVIVEDRLPYDPERRDQVL